jgi:hypothetical protein
MAFFINDYYTKISFALTFITILISLNNFTCYEHSFFKNQSLNQNHEILNILFKKISKSQSQSDVKFRSFPPRFSEIKGLYSSYIHLNFQDNDNSFLGKVSRSYLAALDMNMFVTNFVLCSLIEALPFSKQLQENEEFKKNLQIALEALSLFKDRNYNENIPVYNFWKQENVNGTWSQTPDTMVNLVKMAPHFSETFINILNKIKLDNFAKFIQVFESMCQIFQVVFRIPPDTDDTSVNMAMTGMLYKLNQTNFFSSTHNSKLFTTRNFNLKNDDNNQDLQNTVNNWFRNNSDYSSLFEVLKTKAYRPFINSNFSTVNSSEIKKNNYSDVIDTRTYFVIRGFLEEKFSQKQELILPTTWIFDIDENREFFPLIAMPIFVNNVDFNVATNFLFGTTNLILHHPDKQYINKIFDSEMQKMYSDTIDLLSFSIKNNITSWRPDLALLYYPSVFDFYWLTSRVYSTLKNSELELKNLEKDCKNIYDLFSKSRDILEETLKMKMTETITEKLIEKSSEEYFFVEFLGNTQNYSRNEDALFATSLGLNSYLNIWTKEVKNSQGGIELSYDLDTPEEIKVIVKKLANFLKNNVNTFYSSYEGAFFSGSFKNIASSPSFFPGNFYKFLNGTDLIDHESPTTEYLLSLGVKGFISPEEYDVMMRQIYFGQKVQKDFIPYNLSIFPYWSSPAMTMSVNYLALAKFNCLRN